MIYMNQPMIQSVNPGERSLTLEWADGRRSQFHYLWLRDNCPQLRHKTTNHRVVETSSLPDDVRPAQAFINAAGGLQIVWQHDGHESVFDPSWLRAYDYSNHARRVRQRPVLWDATLGASMPHAHYPTLLKDPEVRRNYLSQFRDYGVGILHDVPVTPGTVLDVGKQFGEVRSTSWGIVFDVKAMVNANSLAYTNLPLVTHTDEAYRNPTPTIQLQHFLQADAAGGESTLVDGFKIAADLRASAPDQFHLLTSMPLHFHFRDTDAELENEGPVIELNALGEVAGIRYSNHSVRPFLLPVDQMEAFYAAYRSFGRMRESPQYRLDIKMASGDLYMVDNRRVLHGRTAFSGSGARHLQSCYIERDELFSRLQVLERKAETPVSHTT